MLIAQLHTITPWSQDLFVHKPSHLPGKHTAWLPFLAHRTIQTYKPSLSYQVPPSPGSRECTCEQSALTRSTTSECKFIPFGSFKRDGYYWQSRNWGQLQIAVCSLSDQATWERGLTLISVLVICVGADKAWCKKCSMAFNTGNLLQTCSWHTAMYEDCFWKPAGEVWRHRSMDVCQVISFHADFGPEWKWITSKKFVQICYEKHTHSLRLCSFHS